MIAEGESLILLQRANVSHS